MTKEKLMSMQDNYIKEWRKLSPACDWTDEEIIEHHEKGDIITLKYCFDMTIPQAKKLLNMVKRERLAENRIIIQGAEHLFGE